MLPLEIQRTLMVIQASRMTIQRARLAIQRARCLIRQKRRTIQNTWSPIQQTRRIIGTSGKVGRATPCAPGTHKPNDGVHGVTCPTGEGMDSCGKFKNFPCAKFRIGSRSANLTGINGISGIVSTDEQLNIMKDTLSNKLSSFTTTLNVANRTEFVPVWTTQPPLAFAEGLAEARLMVADLASTGAQQSSPITGDTEALALLRQQLETRLHVLCRAAFQTFTSLHRVEDAAKVDFEPSDFTRARAGALAGIAETVLDLAEPLTVAPGGGGAAPGEKYGVTAARVGGVDLLWTNFSTAIGAPAEARATRKALSDKLPGDFRKTEAKFAALDDLVVQFGDTAIGADFVNAWFNARKVSALGRRAAKPAPPSPPLPPNP